MKKKIYKRSLSRENAKLMIGYIGISIFILMLSVTKVSATILFDFKASGTNGQAVPTLSDGNYSFTAMNSNIPVISTANFSTGAVRFDGSGGNNSVTYANNVKGYQLPSGNGLSTWMSANSFSVTWVARPFDIIDANSTIWPVLAQTNTLITTCALALGYIPHKSGSGQSTKGVLNYANSTISGTNSCGSAGAQRLDVTAVITATFARTSATAGTWTIYQDGYQIAQKTVSGIQAWPTAQALTIGSLLQTTPGNVGMTAHIDLAELRIDSYNLTASDVKILHDALGVTYSFSTVGKEVPKVQVVSDGNSILYGFGSSPQIGANGYFQQFITNLNASRGVTYRYWNMSGGGKSWDDLNTANTIDGIDALFHSGWTNLLMVQEDTNQFVITNSSPGSTDAATIEGKANTHFDARHVVGWTNWGTTTLQTYAHGSESTRVALNALRRAETAGAHWDVLLDIDNDSTFGSGIPSTSANRGGFGLVAGGTYTTDGTHPNQAGHVILASDATTTLAGQIPQPLTPGFASVTSTSASSIALSSTAAKLGTGPYSYQWYRSIASGTQGTLQSGATSLSLADSTPTTNVIYYYTLVSTDSAGTPAVVAGNQVMAIAQSPIVSGLATAGTLGITTATATATDATLGYGGYTYLWNRSTTNLFTPSSATAVGSQISRTLNDSALSPNTTYYWKLAYIDSQGNTVYSPQITLTTAPAKSTGLNAITTSNITQGTIAQ